MSTFIPKQPSFRPLAEFLPKNDAAHVQGVRLHHTIFVREER
jgi:hypothetical protein